MLYWAKVNYCDFVTQVGHNHRYFPALTHQVQSTLAHWIRVTRSITRSASITREKDHEKYLQGQVELAHIPPPLPLFLSVNYTRPIVGSGKK